MEQWVVRRWVRWGGRLVEWWVVIDEDDEHLHRSFSHIYSKASFNKMN